MNFILLINVKMPRLVGILTFSSRINTIAFKAKHILQHFCFQGQEKFHAPSSDHENKSDNLEA